MKYLYLLLLLGLLFQQNLFAQTKTNLKHLPDGVITILTPAGEDLGVRFQLKSIKVDGVQVKLNTAPEIDSEKFWSMIRWNDSVTEHWLYNNNSWKTELSIDVKDLGNVGQEISIDYLIDTTTDEYFSVGGSSQYLINNEWSLNFSRPLLLTEQSCQRIKHTSNKNKQIRQFKWIVKADLDELNFMMTVDVTARKLRKTRHKLNDLYTNGQHLFATDYKDRIMKFERKNGRFEFTGFLPDPRLQIGEYRQAEQLWLDQEWLVMVGNDQIFFYDLEQQKSTFLPKLRISSLREMLELEKGYLTVGEHIVVDGKSIYIVAETRNQAVIGEFQLKNKKWKIKDKIKINELMGLGIESFVKRGSTWYFLTYGPGRALNIKKAKQKNNKWRLIETVTLDSGFFYSQDSIKLNKNHLVIPLVSENNSEVWVFDLKNSLEANPQILIGDPNELGWQNMSSGFGQQVVIDDDFIYVFSPHVMKKSPETQNLMQESNCLTDTIGQVDVWKNVGESWKKMAKINSKQSQHNILSLIQDEQAVYVVIENSVNDSYQLIPLNQGKLDPKNGIDLDFGYE